MDKIKITKEDYEECLKFILKLRYLWGGATIDFASSGVKRDAGKYIHDHIGGKLAEIAVKKFLKQKYNLNVELGFEKYTSAEDFMLGDIEKVIKSDGTKVSPKLKVEIKATKPSSRWWLISDSEFDSREYDVYILVVIDLPLDHIIRFFKDSLKLDNSELEKAIPDFGTIDAEIKGIVLRDEFKSNTLKFNAGDSVFETEIFEARPKIIGTATAKQLVNDEFILKKIPQPFKINGQYEFYVKNSSRGTETRYVKTISDITITHKILGDYKLGKGKNFLIVDKYLSH